VIPPHGSFRLLQEHLVTLAERSAEDDADDALEAVDPLLELLAKDWPKLNCASIISILFYLARKASVEVGM